MLAGEEREMDMQTRVVPIFVRRMAEIHGLAGADMTYADLVCHAKEHIARLSGKAEMVCGPITTGGFKHPGYNVLLFNHAIDLLRIEGRPMFNQIPYEFQLARLGSEWRGENGDRYCRPILTEFYQPLFETRLFARAWFLPGWESSTGASWEHELLTNMGCAIQYLPEDWIYQLDVSHLS